MKGKPYISHIGGYIFNQIEIDAICILLCPLIVIKMTDTIEFRIRKNFIKDFAHDQGRESNLKRIIN